MCMCVLSWTSPARICRANPAPASGFQLALFHANFVEMFASIKGLSYYRKSTKWKILSKSFSNIAIFAENYVVFLLESQNASSRLLFCHYIFLSWYESV